VKIAIPVSGGSVSAHFGHCEKFAFVEVDPERKTIMGTEWLTPPPHAPGVLPGWLAEQGANVIITGGMGSRAQALFTESGIETVLGASQGTPEQLAEQYLAGGLQAGENLCDH